MHSAISWGRSCLKSPSSFGCKIWVFQGSLYQWESHCLLTSSLESSRRERLLRPLGPKQGALASTTGSSSENVTFSRFFKLCRVYSNSLKMSNVGEFPWSWFLELCAQCPGHWIEARLAVTLFCYKPCCFSYVNDHVFTGLLAWEHDLHMKSKKVCNKTRSPAASLLFKGQGTEQTTVKWPTFHNK